MERCMIVDGSSVIRKVAKRILGSDELVVIEAGNGTEALSMASAQMPDYVIIDSCLSDLDSEDLIRQFRSMDQDNHVKIISLMTQMDLVAMTRAKRAGADEFLLKPFNREHLLRQFNPLRHAA